MLIKEFREVQGPPRHELRYEFGPGLRGQGGLPGPLPSTLLLYILPSVHPSPITSLKTPGKSGRDRSTPPPSHFAEKETDLFFFLNIF